MFKILICLIIICSSFVESANKKYDLTIVGSLNFSGSLARLSISIMDLLKDELKMNFIPTFENNLVDISSDIKKILAENNKVPGNVCLFTEILWHKSPQLGHVYKYAPRSKIKIAYSMLESSLIPPIWAQILNQEFDSVVVPDEFLVDVYKNSGVKIPIFVLPIGLFLEDLLKIEKKRPNVPFIFGCSAVAWPRKNIEMLIWGFARAFGNARNVFLKIHTKGTLNVLQLRRLINYTGARNIELVTINLNWKDYVKFLASFDAYVLLSKGEGFSITPREAMALGIPCVLSNNTGHKTICDSGLVCSVKSDVLEPAYYDVFGQTCGVQYNCKLDDVIKGLFDVYRNYGSYLQKAQKGKRWVQQYLFKNLKNRYRTLIKPKKIILGDKNIITDEYLMTNSKMLYQKYKSLG